MVLLLSAIHSKTGPKITGNLLVDSLLKSLNVSFFLIIVAQGFLLFQFSIFSIIPEFILLWFLLISLIKVPFGRLRYDL